MLLSGEMPATVHPIAYDGIDAETIKKFAMRTSGGAGVSQQEDQLWHKMVSSYKDASSGICSAVARLARRLCTEYVDPEILQALLAVALQLTNAPVFVQWEWVR